MEQVIDIRSKLPFMLKGVDTDNGGEFINNVLLNYCKELQITFTRGRPYRKNDNCFVEQKNDMAVRRTVGYYRFDTEEEYEALQNVYKHLCPLLNFYYCTSSNGFGHFKRFSKRHLFIYDTDNPTELPALNCYTGMRVVFF